MKLHFDSNQQFQIDAVASIADIFEGRPVQPVDYSVIKMGQYDGLLADQVQTELGVGNPMVDFDACLENIRSIQARNKLSGAAAADEGLLGCWEIFDAPANMQRKCPHYSIEMETGTGKTYVYLRTIFELSAKFGMQKFIIVVPSIAIREGVLKNLEITTEHFRKLYNNPVINYWVYDSKKNNMLRQFATGNTLQVLVMNIDAFRKNFIGTEDEQKSNLIYRESDKLSGRPPIEYIQATRPVVIIDEPQSVDSTEKSQEAIKALNPLCTIRYSATHRNTYNLMYRLDPVSAFELKLVKQIIVASVEAEGLTTSPYVKVEQIDNRNGLKAKVRINVQGSGGPIQRSFSIKSGADLYTLSGERAEYQNGHQVTEISAEPGKEHISFNGGRSLQLGEESGGFSGDIRRAQIRETIKRHLDKELSLKDRGIKVLSLFFIDRVANYRTYDEEGKEIPGKYHLMFSEEYAALVSDPKYSDLDTAKISIDATHNGYFAQDKKGILKDTNGNTQADDDVYSLIMKEKERLLSQDEPLRFIFSHSALREGWDNPNVFQICTLNDTASSMKKRQEIGRGLRLPVDRDGYRVRDDSINKLFIMANESYEDFARALQTEYEVECGVVFGKVPFEEIAALTIVLDEKETAIGDAEASKIMDTLVEQGYLDLEGTILPKFDPKSGEVTLKMPSGFEELESAVIDLLSRYQIERHIHRARNERVNKLRKEVEISEDFVELWNRIRPRTTYKVDFKTDDLVREAVKAVKEMPRIQKPRVSLHAGNLVVNQKGVEAQTTLDTFETIELDGQPAPDILAYLQDRTYLTRSTLVRILKESDRLGDFFLNPQQYMDSVINEINHVMSHLLVSGIKYERIDSDIEGAEWEMIEFKSEELIDYLKSLEVKKSVYEYITYDSEVERRFAEQLDRREDIRLFIKLPGWFKIDTPIGAYNPDWAIVKHGDETVYMVRETKYTKDLLKLRSEEADKVRCGEKHFEALGVPFEVADKASDV